MSDLLVTLSTDPSRRAPSIEDEKERLDKEKHLWYPLGPKKPQRADSLRWIYFVREGNVVARAKVDGIELLDPKMELCSFTGEREVVKGYYIQYSGMKITKKPIPHKGFQGFRYVTQMQQRQLEEAFDPAG
jgi:hypothetical protein